MRQELSLFDHVEPGWEAEPEGGSFLSAGQPETGPSILVKKSPLVPSEVYDTYWRFADERQRVFFRRLEGRAGPWTDDPVLREHKFTNAYRASDRVSQYLIRHVIYDGEESPEELFFRTMLFKLFNRIETWELLERELGPIRWASYDYDRYDAVLEGAMSSGEKIYSAAYMMPPPRGYGRTRKHQNHLALLEQMMEEELPRRLAEAPDMAAAFRLILDYPSMGNFLAYQYVTDLNYSPLLDFSEMEFVVPGPGALDGIRKAFTSIGEWSEADVIKIVTESQESEFERLGLEFPSLWGRPLQLIDAQNLFCEVDKYSRVAHPDVQGRSGRTRIKQKFRPQSEPVLYWYPPKWGLNERIARHMEELR